MKLMPFFTRVALLGLIALPAAAAEAPSMDGTWVLSMPDSGPHRSIGEIVKIHHADGQEEYSAEVLFKGARSGIRFTAPEDGLPHPGFDLISGQPAATVVMVKSSPQLQYMTFMPKDSKAEPIRIEHWLSNDGRSIICLLKDKAGVVTSVLTFHRQDQ